MFADTMNKFVNNQLDDFEEYTTNNETCSYSEFVDEIYSIHQELMECYNEYCRDVNTAAVLCEASDTKILDADGKVINEYDSKQEKDLKFSEKVKGFIDRIIEMVKKSINDLCNWVKEKVEYHRRWLSHNKDKISKLDIKYDKSSSSESSFKTYKNILNPDIECLLDIAEVKEFKSSNDTRVNKEDLHKYYANKILGSTEKDTDIDIDKLSSSTIDLMNSIDYGTVIIRKARRQQQTWTNVARNSRVLDKFVKDESFSELRYDALNTVDNIREYIKVMFELMNASVAALKFLLSCGKDKKEEKSNG